MKSVSLGLLMIALAGCQMHTPPHATSWQPVCLILCFTHVEASDQSVDTIGNSVSPRKKRNPKAASPAAASPDGSL
jgi:hypothetical protein